MRLFSVATKKPLPLNLTQKGNELIGAIKAEVIWALNLKALSKLPQFGIDILGIFKLLKSQVPKDSFEIQAFLSIGKL